MTAAYAARRQNLAPAFLAAAMLHLGVFAALTFSASRPSMIPTGTAVPITIVSSAPTTDSRPAEPAPEIQTAQAETPVPQAPPPSPAPPPPQAVQPAPAPAKIAATPTTTPVRPAAAARTPTPRRAFDLDALQASIAQAARSAPAKPAMARRGPTRAETAPQARVDAGQGVSQSSLQGLQQLLERLWNPSCSVEGAAAVTVPVSFTVGEDGRLQGRVSAAGQQTSTDPVVAAAARRAIDAVHEAEPFGAEYRGTSFKVIFDARKACA